MNREEESPTEFKPDFSGLLKQQVTKLQQDAVSASSFFKAPLSIYSKASNENPHYDKNVGTPLIMPITTSIFNNKWTMYGVSPGLPQTKQSFVHEAGKNIQNLLTNL